MKQIIIKFIIFSQFFYILFCLQSDTICIKATNDHFKNSTFQSQRVNNGNLKCITPYLYKCGNKHCALNSENCNSFRILNSYLALQLTRPIANRSKMAKITEEISRIKECQWWLFIGTQTPY